MTSWRLTLSVVSVLLVCPLQSTLAENETEGSVDDNRALFRWVQRKGGIFLAIDLHNTRDESLQFRDDGIDFVGYGIGAERGEEKKYQLSLDFYKPINPTASNYTVHPREVRCFIAKTESGPYWPRLLKNRNSPEAKLGKTDWNQWLREEQDGVRWNELVDRKWEWWKEDKDAEDDEDESSDEDLSSLYKGVEKARRRKEEAEVQRLKDLEERRALGWVIDEDEEGGQEATRAKEEL